MVKDGDEQEKYERRRDTQTKARLRLFLTDMVKLKESICSIPSYPSKINPPQ